MTNILVIDDKEETRLKLQLMLQKAGYAVETVAGPAHAKILMRSGSFDILLVDLNDPFESRKGQESLVFFKEFASKNPQIIFVPMTAWPAGEIRLQIQTYGISNFIEKPIKAARVLQVVEQELELRNLKALNQKLSGELQKVDTTLLPMMPLEQAEIQLIRQALTACDNNVIKAAKLLGLTKSSLYRRLEKHGIAKPSEQASLLTNQLQH